MHTGKVLEFDALKFEGLILEDKQENPIPFYAKDLVERGFITAGQRVSFLIEKKVTGKRAVLICPN